jgi:nicotinamidase-related amidase
MVSKPLIEQRLELCHQNQSQLMIIDVQDRLCAAMPHDCLELALSNMNRLAFAAQTLEIPILATEQYPKGLGKTRKQLTDNLPADLAYCEKSSFSCCGATDFESHLKPKAERPQVVLSGLEAHVCVLQTAAGLQQWGYQVFVVADAICSRSPQNRRNAINRMRYAGIGITNTESVVFEWLGCSAHPKFKDISSLFR